MVHTAAGPPLFLAQILIIKHHHCVDNSRYACNGKNKTAKSEIL